MSLRTVASPQERPQIKRFQLVDLVLAPTFLIVDHNPFDAVFAAAFCGPQGQSLTVPGFYDSEMGYVVRFSPTVEGVWHYTSHSDMPALDGVSGAVVCLANDEPAIHGQLVIDPAHPQHFRFEDGTPCFPLGYEVDWLMMMDQQPSDLTRVEAFLDSIAAAGFNLVTVNAYAYTCRGWVAEDQESDPRYIKPALAPWPGGNEQPDYSRMDPAFFHHVDRVMLDLLQRGILAHVMIHVYNKQVNWPEPGSADDDRYWHYIVARYQAFCNIIWDTAKESYYQPAEYIWDRMGLIRRLDGYRRLLTVHDANTPYAPDKAWSQRWWHPKKDYSDELADFKADQIHGDWYADAVRNYRAARRPYMNIEYGYEEGVQDLPTYGVKQDWREVIRRTWLIAMGGGYVNYYYSNTAWNLFAPQPEPPGYQAMRRFYDFWQGTRYWTLTPDNTPLGDTAREGVYCRANVGVEYVVWDEPGEGFTLTVTGATAPLKATWFDPLTGESVDGGLCDNGAHAFRSPWGAGRWALLRLA
jgi:hypothetical protein